MIELVEEVIEMSFFCVGFKNKIMYMYFFLYFYYVTWCHDDVNYNKSLLPY